LAKLTDGKIIAAGGEHIFDYDDRFGELVRNHSGVEILDPETKTWTTLPDMPHTEEGCGIVLSNGRFSVLTTRRFDSFNCDEQTWKSLADTSVLDLDGGSPLGII
jgi:hypothetical protein